MPNDFRYAAVNRPPGYATVPDGYTRVEERPHAGAPFHDIARHGFVIYERPLTDKETRSYELARVLGEAGERAIAETIVSDAAEYAEQYIEIASDDFEDFRAMVGSHFDGMFSNATGYRPAIADFDGFVRRVLDGLLKRAEKAAEAARDAEFSDIGGPANELPMRRAKRIKTLSKLIRQDGTTKTQKAFVEDLVALGATTRTTMEDRIRPMSRRAFNRANGREQADHDRKVREGGKVSKYWIANPREDRGEYGIGKTEYDYANHLIAKRAIGLAPAPVSLLETAHVEPSAFTNPHDLFAGDGCALDSQFGFDVKGGQDGI
jgi:hypothetical protein